MRNGNNALDTKFAGLDSSSYRTYEEWKPYLALTCISSTYSVLTVPMRNGNFDAVYCIEYKIVVLTVPMRNGNIISVLN